MTEEQQILADTLHRLLADRIEAAGLDPDEAALGQSLFHELDTQGFLSICVSEAAGGSGAGWSDAGIVVNALGFHAAPGLMSQTLMARGLSPDQPAKGPAFLAAAEAGAPNLVGEPAVCTGMTDPSEPALLAGAAMRAMQMTGAAERILEMSAAYAKERIQFGRALAAFQAVQQQLAVLAGEAAAARRASDHAFLAMEQRGLAEAGFEIAVAKIRCGEAAGKVAAIAHQVHGAIGYTYEHRLHRFTRRIWSWRAEAGNERFWSQKLGQAAISRGADALWADITARG